MTRLKHVRNGLFYRLDVVVVIPDDAPDEVVELIEQQLAGKIADASSRIIPKVEGVLFRADMLETAQSVAQALTWQDTTTLTRKHELHRASGTFVVDVTLTLSIPAPDNQLQQKLDFLASSFAVRVCARIQEVTPARPIGSWPPGEPDRCLQFRFMSRPVLSSGFGSVSHPVDDTHAWH